jgi:hypothetical protein
MPPLAGSVAQLGCSSGTLGVWPNRSRSRSVTDTLPSCAAEPIASQVISVSNSVPTHSCRVGRYISSAPGSRHAVIGTSPGQQFGVVALLDNLASLHHYYVVSIADRRKTVRYNETRSTPAKRRHRTLNAQLRGGVHRTGHFIEDQQLWAVDRQGGHRQRQRLPVARGQRGVRQSQIGLGRTSRARSVRARTP